MKIDVPRQIKTDFGWSGHRRQESIAGMDSYLRSIVAHATLFANGFAAGKWTASREPGS